MTISVSSLLMLTVFSFMAIITQQFKVIPVECYACITQVTGRKPYLVMNLCPWYDIPLHSASFTQTAL